MMIPGWLAPWWNWWAGFTDLFDWEAIAAMATLFAVGVALEQASRAKRVEARHGMGVFTVLIGLLEPIVELLSYSSGTLHPDDAKAAIAERVVEQAEEGLSRLSNQETMAVGISDYMGGLPLALQDIRQELPAIADNFSNGSNLYSSIGYIQEAVEDFQHRRSLLKHGSFRTAVFEFGAAIRRHLRGL